MDAIGEDPLLFTRDDALVELGVGKNMVRSIRYWCLATGMIEEADGNGRTNRLQVSQLGQRLLGSNGWDPYLEDMGTLWLLHWQLATNPVRGLVWLLTFSVYLAEEFTKHNLTKFISGQFERLEIRTTQKMIEREVDCCLLTYVSSQSKLASQFEDTLNCPLNELDLIRFTPEESIYRFNIGPKNTLPVNIFGYALFTYLTYFLGNRRTIAVEDCIYPSGSPGQIFKLDENSVVEYLDVLETLANGHLRVQETAGLRQIYIHDADNEILQAQALELLRTYYE